MFHNLAGTATEPAFAWERRRILRTSVVSLFALAAGRAVAGCGAAGTPREAVADDAGIAPTRAPTATPANPPIPDAAVSPSPGRDAAVMAATPPAIPCARSTTFAPIVDDGPRAAFLHTSQSTTADWLTIGVAMTGHLSVLPDTVLSLLRGLDALRLGYPVSMLELSLRTASRARRAGASDDLVLVALCHRLGMAFTVEGYAELSAAVLRGYVSDSAYRVARHHPEYSTRRARPAQGAGSARYEQQTWHADAQRFAREWADPSYEPGEDSLALDEFEPLVRAKLGLSLHDPYLTRTDCIGAGS